MRPVLIDHFDREPAYIAVRLGLPDEYLNSLPDDEVVHCMDERLCPLWGYRRMLMKPDNYAYRMRYFEDEEEAEKKVKDLVGFFEATGLTYQYKLNGEFCDYESSED